VRQREQQLKTEVLLEAQRFGGKVMLHGERSCEGELAAWGEVYAFWEPLDVTDPKSVQTVDEVFADAHRAISREAKAAAEGSSGGGGGGALSPHLELVRVPVMDERAPSPIDLDDVTQAVMGRLQHSTTTSLFSSSSSSSSKTIPPPSSRAWVFNCQLGRGRTTTGMVPASMLLEAHARQRVRIALPMVRSCFCAACNSFYSICFCKQDFSRFLSFSASLSFIIAARLSHLSHLF